MKKILYSLALMPFIFGCSSNHPEEEATIKQDSLMVIINSQKELIKDNDNSIQSFIKGFNDIQHNLDIIKEKERILINTSKDSEMLKSKEEQIVADIQSIYDMMNKNKKQLSSLRSQLKKSNGKNGELEKFISRLNSQIETKDLQIGDLRTQLELLNIAMTDLHIDYQAATEELEIKSQMLNTAYYSFGTSKELIKNGVLTKEGGFIGIGKIQKMKNDFNKTYFTQVDISKSKTIMLAAKKAKLITTHPSESYKIEGADGKAEKLTIINAEEFWSASKYLVIVVN